MENNIDWIKTVKEQWNNTKDREVIGYLVNGNMSVPKADGNRHYEKLKVWLADNASQPEFTKSELLKRTKEAKKEEIKTAKKANQNKPFELLKHTWQGGEKTRNKLKIAIDLGVRMGNKKGVLWDINGVDVIVTKAEAYELLDYIDTKLYRTKGQEIRLMGDIKRATSIEEVEKVFWVDI